MTVGIRDDQRHCSESPRSSVPEGTRNSGNPALAMICRPAPAGLRYCWTILCRRAWRDCDTAGYPLPSRFAGLRYRRAIYDVSLRGTGPSKGVAGAQRCRFRRLLPREGLLRSARIVVQQVSVAGALGDRKLHLLAIHFGSWRLPSFQTLRFVLTPTPIHPIN